MKETNKKGTKLTGEFKKTKSLESFMDNTIREVLVYSGLSDYEVNYKFSKKSKNRNGGIVLAEVSVNPEYLNANIIIRPELVHLYYAGHVETVRRAICHELSHIRTEKLARVALDRFASPTSLREEVEALTELYSRMLYKQIYNNGNKKEESKEVKENKESKKGKKK